MRALLESSWLKFGPAGRGTYDWVTGPPSPPSVERQVQGHHWNQLNRGEEPGRPELVLYVVLYVVLPVASLLALGLLVLLAYRRRSCHKLSLSSFAVIARGNQDADVLSSLTGRGARHPSASSSSSGSSEASDSGVFLMVYLPLPLEETLTRVTRAASVSSCHRDAAWMNMDDLEARLCPEGKTSGCFV